MGICPTETWGKSIEMDGNECLNAVVDREMEVGFKCVDILETNVKVKTENLKMHRIFTSS